MKTLCLRENGLVKAKAEGSTYISAPKRYFYQAKKYTQ